jgi:hypothetical protein
MAGLMMTVAMFGAVGGQAPLAAFIKATEWRQAMEIIGFAGLILAGLSGSLSVIKRPIISVKNTSCPRGLPCWSAKKNL